MGGYAHPGKSTWSKSKICPTNCVAMAEIVNLPSKFVSSNPFFVIGETHWIMWYDSRSSLCHNLKHCPRSRYLLVKGVIETVNDNDTAGEASSSAQKVAPLVKLDPAHPITLNNKHIEIPEPSHEIDTLLAARRKEYREDENDLEDVAVFECPDHCEAVLAGANDYYDIDDDEDMDHFDSDGDYAVPASPPNVTAANKAKDKMKQINADWKHDSEWVIKHVENLMPPPMEATPSATMAVQRELKAMLKDQENATTLKDLGWYMPPDLIGDNLFQWIVELHSFDEDLPIAKDLKLRYSISSLTSIQCQLFSHRNVNSIIFEIRFPPSFPLAPPFFRIVTPRFLPFIQGGGGHVTGGM